jgi:hypothetical protein
MRVIFWPLGREKHLPQGKGKVLHSFMMGTEPALSAADNVDVIRFMEEEVLRLARKRAFEGIFTTNTSPLTQVLILPNQLAKFLNKSRLLNNIEKIPRARDLNFK